MSEFLEVQCRWGGRAGAGRKGLRRGWASIKEDIKESNLGRPGCRPGVDLEAKKNEQSHLRSGRTASDEKTQQIRDLGLPSSACGAQSRELRSIEHGAEQKHHCNFALAAELRTGGESISPLCRTAAKRTVAIAPPPTDSIAHSSCLRLLSRWHYPWRWLSLLLPLPLLLLLLPPLLLLLPLPLLLLLLLLLDNVRPQICP